MMTTAITINIILAVCVIIILTLHNIHANMDVLIEVIKKQNTIIIAMDKEVQTHKKELDKEHK